MEKQVVAEISVVPLGTGGPGVSDYVAACLKIVEEEKDISYRLTPMGTIVEGPLKKVLDVTERMHEVPSRAPRDRQGGRSPARNRKW